MPQRTKHDRNELFLEYLTSYEEEVYPFLKTKGVVNQGQKGLSGAMKEHSKGWYKKKQAFKERAMKKAVEKLENQVAEKVYKPSIEQLNRIHSKILRISEMQLDEIIVVDCESGLETLNTKASRIMPVEKIREITKVEKGEPTKTVLDLTPQQEDTPLTDEQKKVLEEYKKSKG